MYPAEADFSPDYLMRVNMGLIPGTRRVFGAGQVLGATSGNVPQDIWTQGGAYPWLTTATAIKARSTSPADAPGGAGCQSISLLGLDDVIYAERTQPLTLNGTNFVNFSTQVLRINFVVGVLPGIANAICSNVGDILICRQDNDAVLAVIPAGKGMSRQSQYTVPAGMILLAAGWDEGVNALAGGSATRSADIEPYFRAPGQIFRQPRVITASDGNPTTLFLRTFALVNEKNDFQFRVVNVSSSSATAVTGAWEGILAPKPTP